MPAKDGFDQDFRLPRFLVNEHEQQGIGKEWDSAVISSRVLKASIWAAAATAISIAVLSVGNSMTFVADVAASLLDKSALQPDTDKSTPAVELIAATQVLPPSEPASEILVRQFQAWAADKDAQVEPVEHVQDGRTQGTENTQFRQFQAWAAEKDARAQVGPVEHIEDVPAQVTEDVQFKEFEAWAAEKDAQALSVQDAKALVAQEGPSQVTGNTQARRPVQQHRHTKPIQNARAEIRTARNLRKGVSLQQNARVQVPLAQDVRTQK
jgi:hypothetical protein